MAGERGRRLSITTMRIRCNGPEAGRGDREARGTSNVQALEHETMIADLFHAKVANRWWGKSGR